MLPHFDIFLENAPVAAAMFDRDMRYIAASRRWLDDYGLPDDVTGKCHYDLLPIPERWKQIHRRVLRGATLSEKEDRFDRRDGSVQWVRWEARPWYSSDSNIGGIIIFADDVTKHVQAREELIKTQQRLMAIMEAVPVGIAVSTDISCDEATGNAAMLSQFDMKPEENISASAPDPSAAGRRVRFFRNGTEISALELPLQRAISERAQIPPMELEVILPTGRRVFLEGSGAPIVGKDGEILGGVAVSVDIAERKRAEAALQDADRRKDEFIATLAHELRNPLAPICNGLAVLKRGTKTDADADRLLTMMERQTRHLVRLVDDLLEISRIKRGKIKLVKDRVNLASVIGDALDMNRDLIGEAGLHLHVNLPDEPLWLDVDAVRLTQVFANLLNNAAKHTNPGGRIDVTATRANDHVSVSVADTGVGIAKDRLSDVFDLFSQAGDTQGRSERGLGIGLALARSLVEMHGGAIEAQSDGEGQGARFIVRLPWDASIAAGDSPSRTTAPQAQTSRRVLVVDDEPDVADSLALLLQILGAEVCVARGGAAALEICAKFAPDLVFIDIGMPGMDGFETARRIRELATGRHATLVALTGWDGQEISRRTVEAGFDRHLRKPADLPDLEALLSSAPQTRG